MAVTLHEGSPHSDGHRLAATADIDGPASYSTGGQEVTAASLGLAYIESAHAAASNAGSRVVVVAPGGKGPKATIKLIWIVLSTGVEVAAAVDLSADSVRIRARGL